MKNIFIFGICCLGWVALNAQTTFNMQQAIDYAYNNNIEVKNSLLNIADAEQQILERRAIGLPQVNGKLEFQHFVQVPKMALPEALSPSGTDPQLVSFQLKNNFTPSITASSLIFDSSYLTGLKAARLYKSFVQKQLDTKKNEVRDQVTGAYLPLLLIDEGIKLIDQNKGNLQQLIKETKALYKEGFVEQLDVDRLELSNANLTAERENLVRQRETVANALKFVIGFPKDDELILSETIESLLAVGDTTYNTAAFNIKNKKQYQVADLNIQLNQLNVELNQRGYLPNLAAFASYSYQFLGDNLKDGFWAPSFVVGASINVPIFDGFEKRSKIERAKIQLSTSENQRKILTESIYLDIKNTSIAFENAMNSVNNREKNVALAQRIYDTTKIKYKEGVGSSLELSQAEQALFSAQNNYTQAVYDAIVAKMDLDSALAD